MADHDTAPRTSPRTDPLDALRADPGATALCLDFDGTLAPIVDDPEASRPLPGTVELLERLAGRYAAVALISGRPASFLADHARAHGVRYVGLYGIETITEDGDVATDPEADGYRDAVAAARADAASHPAVTGSGAWVEDKGLALGLHLRRVADPARWDGPVGDAARELAERHGLEVAPGKMVYELRPPVRRDKGDAVRTVLDATGARHVLMAGDDLGDLAAFAVVAESGGVRVAVRSDESPVKLLDAADVVVDGVEGLCDLLATL